MHFKVVVPGKSTRNFEDSSVAISYMRIVVPCYFEDDEAKDYIARRENFNLSYGDSSASLRVVE